MLIVEGNIGAGKSTFLGLLRRVFPHLQTTLEPLDSWENQVSGTSLLTQFYQEPLRWAYTFEMLTAFSRAKQYKQVCANPGAIIERSMYAGYYCFAYNSYQQGYLQPVEWQLYSEWFAFLSSQCKVPTGIIYLRVSPETSLVRIKKRNRAAEESISLEYLRQIYDRYEKWLIKGEYRELSSVPVHVIDANQEFENDPVQLAKITHSLKHFLVSINQTITKHSHP